jgi:alpha-beta hydrolase superfamily lysophospholipase
MRSLLARVSPSSNSELQALSLRITFRMRLNRKLCRVLFALLLYLAFCTVAGIYLADGALHPPRRTLTGQETAAFRQSVEVLHGQLRDVAITSADGIELRGWLVTSPHPNDDAVLLLHGLGDNRLGMTGYAQFLLGHGFTVLLPDARAHGSSGGSLATFGLLERNDITQWVQFLHAQTRAHCLYGMGESMGAAQLLQSLSSVPQFCAVVAESSFSTFREIAYDRMGQPFHLGPWVGRTFLWPVVEIAFLRARWKYGLDMDNASPQDSVARTEVPVLLIHGEVDGNIPVRHSRLVHERAPTTVSWEVPGADHCGALSTAPDEFKRVLLTWFSSDSPRMKRVPAE